MAVTITIDKAGRVVVPKPVRDRLGLEPGTELELTEWRDGVLLRPRSEHPSLVKVGRVWVHQGEPQGDLDIKASIKREREDRIRHLMQPGK